MDDANKTSDFDKDFMQGVQAEVAEEKAVQQEKTKQRNKSFVVIGVLLVLIAIALTAVIMLSLNRNAQGGEDATSDIIDNDDKRDSDKGSSREVEGDDEDDTSGEIASIRMACEAKSRRYDFYKDNTYDITEGDDFETVESGTYKIDLTRFTLKNEETNKTRDAFYEEGKLTDGGAEYSCEEYDDA